MLGHYRVLPARDELNPTPEAPRRLDIRAYEIFQKKQEGALKITLEP
jgi:hypothetical protein